jgi:hypothetical protein
MTLEKAFGEELQKAREQKGLTQENLGFKSGYHRTYISVRTPKELIKLIKDKSATRFIMQLNCGAQSVKKIQYNRQRRVFLVFNEIDDTRQVLTSKQLMSPRYSNIARAMRAGALFTESPT